MLYACNGHQDSLSSTLHECLLDKVEQFEDRIYVFPVSVFTVSSKEPCALYAFNKCLLNNQIRECLSWNTEKYRVRLY